MLKSAQVNAAQRRELTAVEFPAVVGLIAKRARTRRGAQALASMHPWDGRAPLRRLRQGELLSLWETSPELLTISAFDESLDALLNPAGWLLPEHWRQLREGLQSVAVLLSAVGGLVWPAHTPAPPGVHLGIDLLQVTADVLPDPSPIAEKLKRYFNEEGELDPLRVPGLAALYKTRTQCYQAVHNKLQKRLSDAPDAFQESTVVERNGRFCLPVRTDRRSQVAGLVLDRSSSGATVFVEPMEVVSLNNDFVEADRAYLQAVQAFLQDFLTELRTQKDAFLSWRDFQGEVDEILALLAWQTLCEGMLPDLGQGMGAPSAFHLEAARHPLLLPAVRESLALDVLDHEVVPLTMALDGRCAGLVISGSNTGGKTVVLKTVGLLLALGHAGCAIPAKAGSALPTLSTLHADIGDHQTLMGSLSTFSSHIVHLKQILQEARPGGLVLLDELGTGTDPKEGAALATAVLQTLVRRDCFVLCTTHLGDISHWALKHPRFQNASVQFDESKLAPTYRLLVGQPGQSRALAIAAQLGLPAFVLGMAERALGRREQDWREFLKQLEADRAKLMEEMTLLQVQRIALEKDRTILQAREEKMRDQQEQFRLEARQQLERALDFIDHESKRLLKEMKAKEKAGERADRLGTEADSRIKTIAQIAHQETGKLQAQGTAKPSDPSIALGAYARHRGVGVEGRVVAIKGDRVSLQSLQGKMLEARMAELEPIVRAEIKTEAVGRVRTHGATLHAESELYLIGRASDDIDMAVHRFVEEALGTGQKFIRIVHGHGTGKLKAAVRDALKGHPGIARVEDAPAAQGGAGATCVTLK